ncbi:cytochrome P450 [Blakeslea trispora]|nr:cytochrome P450 [Blakeslea trispora]
MNYLDTITKLPPIQSALKVLSQLPVTDRLMKMYSNATQKELVFLGAAAFVTIHSLIGLIKQQREKLNLPPKVPFSLPFVGHTPYLLLASNRFLDFCIERYGEIFQIDHLGQTITVTSGRCAEEAMKANTDDLSVEHGILRDVLFLHYVLDETTMEIGFHVNPVVAKSSIPSRKMPDYIPGIQEGLERGLNNLMNPNGEPTLVKDPNSFLQQFVAYMSVPTLLGDEVATNAEVIDSFAGFTGDITGNIGIFLSVPKALHPMILPYLQSLHKHHHVMEKHIVPVIHKRRQIMQEAELAGKDHGLESNFLQGLIESKKKEEDGTEQVYPADVVSRAVLLIAFASVHTTSMNLSFCLYWLLARPDLMQAIIQEIKQVLPGNTPITAEAINEMKVLNNFIREALRHGADKLANGKKAMKDYTFYNGYQVPKGQLVQSSVRQLTFGSNSALTDVQEMNPDSSMNKPCSKPSKDFVAFGMGKRLCPGRFFAIQEIQMSLVYLLKHYEVKTVDGKRPTPVKYLAGSFATNNNSPLLFTPRQ